MANTPRSQARRNHARHPTACAPAQPASCPPRPSTRSLGDAPAPPPRLPPPPPSPPPPSSRPPAVVIPPPPPPPLTAAAFSAASCGRHCAGRESWRAPHSVGNTIHPPGPVRAVTVASSRLDGTHPGRRRSIGGSHQARRHSIYRHCDRPSAACRTRNPPRFSIQSSTCVWKGKRHERSIAQYSTHG